MNDVAKIFYSIGEPFAAGLFEEPQKGYFYRYSLAYTRYFEHLRPAEYVPGDLLYPRGKKFFDDGCAMRPQVANTYQVDWELLEKKSTHAAEILKEFTSVSKNYANWEIMKQMHPEIVVIFEKHPDIPEYFDGYTHASPNYKRIIREGLNSYRKRAQDTKNAEFREGLSMLLSAMEDYLARSVAYLKSVGAPKELTAAMERVPFAPAESYYE